jgi:hypothetical protein
MDQPGTRIQGGAGARGPIHDRAVLVGGDTMDGLETGLPAGTRPTVVHNPASLAGLCPAAVFLVVV